MLNPLPQRRTTGAAESDFGSALRLVTPRRPVEAERPRLGTVLVDAGVLAPADLLKVLAMQQREEARLGEILLAHGMISQAQLMAALATQWRARVIDPAFEPPDPRLVDRYTPERCLRDTILPWRRLGSLTVVITARPHLFARHEEALTRMFGPVVMALAQEQEVFQAVQQIRAKALVRRAESRVAEPLSCREFVSRRKQRVLLALCIAALLIALAAPRLGFALLTGWAVATLVLQMALKATATGLVWHGLRAEARARRRASADLEAAARATPPAAPLALASALPAFNSRRSRPAIARLPVVSVMVPLFREEHIASHLIQRLSRLTYPKELLDVCLVMEASDDTTRLTLSRTPLPGWIRVITVPRGAVQTKPRALNYALEFTRGSIVGVWDAEDAPEPDQIHKVVQRFHERPAEVACLQGALDFYNAGTNWLSRCFAVEYASWFRVVLPGLARLGWAIPLGGTTLFFRREALDEIGGWDAHNVTEDADLGMRLYRMGYRTELIESTTFEEANCRALPWVKQRSRWLKGYALTWAVHMRNPARLWRDLGAWQFAGFQLLFLGALSQFVLAPFLWSFWLVVLGLWHPLSGWMPGWAVWTLAITFFASELVNIATGLTGTRRAGHPALYKWVPTLHFYYPLGSLASYKALWEIVTKPFYWDKTTHGLHAEDDELAPIIVVAPANAPAPAALNPAPRPT
ncbi:glycosyltransferase family 2 protein [Vannielia litorea]|uniref:Glycosyltransferase, catalytic subunit of cellulose synthase and poly-beta-1,6-N-acetylglucosamine synthase n=1 Tax=Vannielia litorea TaxID=1217970 RepID=A0A1N6EJF1_9RHOB|nr:glycosyltransferase [Vannielia litorea]SIN83134.1 Glycosyltransferase, catalytic subunit of cellulose synthase and poly-beta-1,6-N-acetylglucosamine synthase [Vannielia litorea]